MFVEIVGIMPNLITLANLTLGVHMMHDLGWVILSLFSVTVLQVLHGVTQYQWHILVT